MAKPVEFVKLVESMIRDGVTTFVECGAGNRLTGLVGLITKDATAISVDASNGKKNGIGDLAKTLAQLAALGYSVDLKDWQGGEKGLRDARPTPKMAVKLTGATYRSTPKKNFPAPRLDAMKTSDAASVPGAKHPGLAAEGGDSSLLSQALSAAQASIDAMTKLQEQTAALHLQFLQGQAAAQSSVQALVEQQQALYATLSNGSVIPAPGRPAQSVAVNIPSPSPLPSPAPIREAVAVPPKATVLPVLPVLLSVVSEKTGYPAETINAEMDLEADLGIDSIKRVEILSAVSEKLPGAPKVKPEHLGTLRNLKQIAAYLSEGMASVPSAAQVAAPAPVAVTNAAQPSVLPVLISVVSDKTGYPAETINPEMDLEADLGIDSIKRVEILSAVSEKLPGAPKVKPEHLGTLRNLKQIAAYLSEGMTVSAPAAAPVAAPKGDVLPVLLAVVADKTGYPAETINPEMDLEADLGIDSIKRVEILSAVSEKLPGAPKVKPEHLGTLRNLKQIAAYLSEGMPTAPVAAPVAAAPKGDVLPVLLAVVADKTGYPSETINPEMDLEADLGIDSIKRVEILSAVAEKLPNAPRVKPEHLGTLRNLNQIAAYLSAGTSVAAPAPVAAPVVVASEEPCTISRLVPEMIPVGPRDVAPSTSPSSSPSPRTAASTPP
ncbi:MAG: phosphopantetheine-binding protein [Elusimicrobiota bacterium]|nr:MAG: phosphopantetheine-binding protein [Elusimicrobiota bacterium]